MSKLLSVLVALWLVPQRSPWLCRECGSIRTHLGQFGNLLTKVDGQVFCKGCSALMAPATTLSPFDVAPREVAK